MLKDFIIPGVYSKIDASAAVQSSNNNAKTIAILAKANSGEDNKPYAPISFRDAENVFGEDSIIIDLMRVSILNGGSKFILVKVAEGVDGADYGAALDALFLEEAVQIVITDTMIEEDLEKIKQHCIDATNNRKERIAILGVPKNTSILDVKQLGEKLNTGRVYISYPNVLDSNGDEMDGIYNAAALAGIISSQTDVALPITNVEVKGFFGLKTKLRDTEMEDLINSGIIPLESRNGITRIVRAVSTYTKDSEGRPDKVWQELTTNTITDFVFSDLRDRLNRKFSRAKNNQRTRDAIRTEVLNALINYQDLEYIGNVEADDVSVSVNPNNGDRVDITFIYRVLTPLNIIHLTGHLTF